MSQARETRQEEELMKKFDLVIAGEGLAASRTIESYREPGGCGQIALLSRSPDLPYHHPTLSKHCLRGETLVGDTLERELVVGRSR